MAVTFDQRPTVFGDRIIVTGTFASGDSSIDLSSMMSSVDACIANTSTALAEVTVDPDGTPAGLQPARWGRVVRAADDPGTSAERCRGNRDGHRDGSNRGGDRGAARRV